MISPHETSPDIIDQAEHLANVFFLIGEAEDTGEEIIARLTWYKQILRQVDVVDNSLGGHSLKEKVAAAQVLREQLEAGNLPGRLREVVEETLEEGSPNAVLGWLLRHFPLG